MAYYTGSANSFDDLLTALIDACVDGGWTWADGILSKGGAYVRPYVSLTRSPTEGAGLLIQGGTGKIGSSLVDGSPVIPRLGNPGNGPYGGSDVFWPATYHISLFTDPDEVFVVLRFNVDYHYWIAFGVSDISGVGGTGLWVAGVTQRGSASAGQVAFSIEKNRGGNTYGSRGGGLFWHSTRPAISLCCDTIHVGLDGTGWKGGASDESPGAINGIYQASPHIERMPSAWNSDSPLVPIAVMLWRASSKCSLVASLRNARYIRLDSYEPGQILTLGADRWMVHPFYLKNAAVRDGGSVINHSGTFGFAVRYDGP